MLFNLMLFFGSWQFSLSLMSFGCGSNLIIKFYKRLSLGSMFVQLLSVFGFIMVYLMMQAQLTVGLLL